MTSTMEKITGVSIVGAWGSLAASQAVHDSLSVTAVCLAIVASIVGIIAGIYTIKLRRQQSDELAAKHSKSGNEGN